MIDALHLRMLLEELNNLLGVLGMTLKAEGESLSSLQQEECCEWRDSCSLISEQDGTDVGDKCSRTNCVCKRDAVVAWVCICNRCILAGLLLVELAGIYNNTTQCCSMTADELGCRVNHDVGSMLDRTNQVWGSKSVVYY